MQNLGNRCKKWIEKVIATTMDIDLFIAIEKPVESPYLDMNGRISVYNFCRSIYVTFGSRLWKYCKLLIKCIFLAEF